MTGHAWIGHLRIVVVRLAHSVRGLMVAVLLDAMLQVILELFCFELAAAGSFQHGCRAGEAVLPAGAGDRGAGHRGAVPQLIVHGEVFLRGKEDAHPHAEGGFVPAADVVIVGGGVTGASTAFQLARRNAGKIVLVERNTVGAGPTAKSIGIIRLHYSYEPLIRLAVRSLEMFTRFEELTGGTADFTRGGFLLLATHAQLPAVEENVALQRRLGVRTSILSREEIARFDSRMNLDDVGGAAFEPDSGYADGYATTASFAAAARKRGVEVWEGTRVERIVTQSGNVTGLHTSRGPVETARVLVAAGPWTPVLMSTAGVSVPIQASRQQVVQLEPPAEFGRLEVVIEDMTQGFYARPESRSSVLAGVLEEEAEQIVPPDGFSQGVDFEFVTRVSRLWARRYPGASEAGVRGGYASVYDITPDWQPVLGAVDTVEGLFIAAGFSGHGFKLGPALGECLAALIMGERPEIDISSFALSRFATGRLIRGRHTQGILG